LRAVAEVRDQWPGQLAGSLLVALHLEDGDVDDA
jgi:hypothetical protein